MFLVHMTVSGIFAYAALKAISVPRMTRFPLLYGI